jgi:hypothetical protein
VPKSSQIGVSGAAGARRAIGPQDRTSELQNLIHRHNQLAERYRSFLHRHPGPIPASHPGVMGKRTFVFVKETPSGLKALPLKDQRELRQSETRRRDVLAIRQPFVAAWWPESRATASPAQRDGQEWREEFDRVADRTREHYTRNRDAERVKDLPLVRLGKTIGGEELLRAIDLQVQFMNADISAVSGDPAHSDATAPKTPPTVNVKDLRNTRRRWLTGGWNEKLRSVRIAKDHTMKEAAHECGLTGLKPEDTYRRWESERPPSVSNLRGV